MCYVLCAMCYVLCPMSYVLCAICYVLCDMCYVLCAMCYVLCAMSYVLCAICYMLCAMCYVLPKLNSYFQYIVYAIYQKSHKAKILSQTINSRPFQMRKKGLESRIINSRPRSKYNHTKWPVLY